MESIASGDVEILVHITAASRGQDDARYRALARAYMEFEPVVRLRINGESASDEVEDLGEQAQSQLQEELRGELRRPTHEERESAASYRPVDEDEASTGRRISTQSDSLHRNGPSRSLDSPMLSFNSADDNIDSPVFRALDTSYEEVSVRNHNTQNSSDSWRPPLSVVADSQPEHGRAMPAFTSPSGFLELYLPRRDQSEGPSSQLGLGEREEQDIGKEQYSASRETGETSSECGRVQSSPSPIKRTRLRIDGKPYSENRSHEAPPTQDPDLDLKRKWPGSSSDDIYTSSAPPRTTNNSIVLPEPKSRPAKRQRTETSNDRSPKVTATPPSSSIVAPVSSPPSIHAPAKWQHTLEIRPTPPVTSVGELKPEDFITATLHKLIKNKKMSAACPFRPVAVVRELRPMERGYWLVNCESWPDARRKKCWTYLGKCVGKDLVGWGVWCVRDAEYLTIRVYCWGIIVEHIYLLLYLASDNKIKGTGACWIGGDGEAVIKMPS